MNSKEYSVKSLTDLKKFAETLMDSLEALDDSATVIALSGDLGAGKTAFVQRLGDVLGVEEAITSPTFAIMKRYSTINDKFSQLLHMDAYRLESEEELGPLNFTELLNEKKTLFCIEWAEKINKSLPKNTLSLNFSINPDDSRTVQVTKE